MRNDQTYVYLGTYGISVLINNLLAGYILCKHIYPITIIHDELINVRQKDEEKKISKIRNNRMEEARYICECILPFGNANAIQCNGRCKNPSPLGLAWLGSADGRTCAQFHEIIAILFTVQIIRSVTSKICFGLSCLFCQSNECVYVCSEE